LGVAIFGGSIATKVDCGGGVLAMVEVCVNGNGQF